MAGSVCKGTGGVEGTIEGEMFNLYPPKYSLSSDRRSHAVTVTQRRKFWDLALVELGTCCCGEKIETEGAFGPSGFAARCIGDRCFLPSS